MKIIKLSKRLLSFILAIAIIASLLPMSMVFADTTQGGMAIREFLDYENISEYALPTLAWGVNAGLIQGANNKLMPKDSATRAQVATILMRFSETIVK